MLISISANVLEYSIGSEYREGYTYQTTAYQITYVYGRGGTTTIQYRMDFYLLDGTDGLIGIIATYAYGDSNYWKPRMEKMIADIKR